MRDQSTTRRSSPRFSGRAVGGMALGMFAFATFAAIIAACSNGSAPGGNGDRTVNDTRPHDGGMPQPQPTGDSAITFPVYDGYAAPDGYSPFNACKTCACPADQFCLGGITGMTTVTSCAAVDGSTTLKAGCNEIPAACAAKPDCTCLIEAVKGAFPCYPVCSDAIGGFTLYCPVP